MIFRSLIIVFILTLIDVYVYQAVKVVFKSSTLIQPRTIHLIFWSFNLVCYGIILAAVIIDWHLWPKAIRTYLFAFVFIYYFSKLFVVLFLLIDDVLRIVRWLFGRQAGSATVAGGAVEPGSGYISRLDFLMKAGLIAGALPFASMIFGMIKGAYSYNLKRVKLKVDNLPESFNGFRIVHISDIHSGSFTRHAPVSSAIDLIASQKPDVVFFTGDLVNDLASEMEPFMETFSRIEAPYGVFSILGNHDYGDYYAWPSPDEKQKNLEALKNVHKNLGWRLLLDEHLYLEKNNDRIGIIGVQNWSNQMRFARYGNLQKALDGFTPVSFNVLLSHDPSHWRAEVLDKNQFIHLTLSGHTHGMQFGIEIPGFKWSPVQYIYREWAGLYKADSQYLYVNRGFGFLGYPGRVGILPEITLIELQKA